jgi:hypothetical protein
MASPSMGRFADLVQHAERRSGGFPAPAAHWTAECPAAGSWMLRCGGFHAKSANAPGLAVA